MISLEDAKKLKVGTILYHAQHVGSDGSAQRWRVNGKVKVWKRSPERVKIPLKHGLYSYGYLTEDTLHLLCLEDPTQEGGGE